ncbi:MAG: DNA mismatch repair endonuclease MutL [Planctomycetes bacterium]|nr:DNA mismatch repair endonuclease MutL [Planctomycetota bacterium]
MTRMPIHKLSTLLINQIAAGEVIERPASVVKELVDNSLDAGARRVDIAIEEGGTRLIRISDDGAGIPADELPLAVAPHATSKLQTPDQLACITTLGFRGEALASIASVSRLRLTSRATVNGKLAEAGAVIESSDESVGEVTPCGASPGTAVEVRDLFFNTPARRKFMRSASTEFGHISEIVGRIAMVRPDVSFTLTHNGRRVMALDGDATPHGRRLRCVEVMGKELDEALLEFEYDDALRPGLAEGDQPMRVWGLVGLPAIARATGKFQYVCLNGRPIRDRNLTHAIRESYRGLIPPDQQPVVVAMIKIDPGEVDVNVHPSKAEVRFHNAGRVHGLLLTAMRQRLLAADLTPSAVIGGQRPSFASWSGGGNGGAGHENTFAPASPGNTPGNGASPAPTISVSSFVDYFKSMAPQQKGFVYQQVREELAREQPETLADEPAPLTPPAAAAAADMMPASSVLQVHKSYLVTQDEQGLVIVDQHALHERVMFEELKARIAGKNLESQRLLMPTVVKASPRRLAALEGLSPLLERIGVEASPIGPEAIGVHAFPSFLFDRGVEAAPFVEDLLDRAENGEFDLDHAGANEAVLHEVLDMMACKAAVKAGDRMSQAELSALMTRKDEIERAGSCPHGRPTTIRLTLRELEKQFKRT